MIYVALLRGINVGGNNKVSMAQLKAAFEKVGLESVKTYINSGNVVFRDDNRTSSELVTLLEKTIYDEFGFTVNVLVCDFGTIKAINEALPGSWRNDDTMKCDVMFLWNDVNREDILHDLVIKPEIDDVRYVPGAILFAVDRQHVTKSGLMKLAAMPLYKRMTIRNCNTVRKLFILMNSLAETKT